MSAEVLAARQLIGDAVAKHGPQVVTDLPVLALSVRMVGDADPGDPEVLRQRSVLIEPVIHPMLDTIMVASGATKVGRYTWVLGLGEESSPDPLNAMIGALAPGLIVDRSMCDGSRGKPADLTGKHLNGSYNRLLTSLRGTAAYPVLGSPRGRGSLCCYFPGRTPHRYGVVRASVSDRAMYLQAVTHHLYVPYDVAAVNLNLRPAGRTKSEARPVTGAEAAAVMEWARSEGVTITEAMPGVAATLQHMSSRTLAAWPVPGRPAQAMVAVGRRVPAAARAELGCSDSDRSVVITKASALAVQQAACHGDVNASVDPAVADVVAMHAAAPIEDGRLRDYQRIAVGLWLSTRLGFVNALAPGMGKTICTLVAMQHKAAMTPAWRGLVVVEANVRRQWASEAKEWFPQARTVVVDSRSRLVEVSEQCEAAGDGPVLVIVSYALANGLLGAETPTAAEQAPTPAVLASGQGLLFSSEVLATLGSPQPADDAVTAADAVETEPLSPAEVADRQLAVLRWHDLVCDEAVGLRSSGSALTKVLWQLRERSDVAVALTGTPINTGLDDLGRMLSWVRQDPEMFHGHRLDKSFHLTDAAQLADYRDAIGPLVFRRDKSEISDEIPQVCSQVVKLQPTSAERRLASAAQHELRRAYEELVAAIEVAERTNPDDPRFGEVKAQLRATRGAWLGGTTLARMASSDPTALLGSESSGVALLAGQGLVEAATAQRPTKRAWAVDYCVKAVPDGERILVFTEFATVARRLIDELRERGLRVGAVLGGGGKARDRDVDAFRAGDLDVLVCTSAGERGLNLQTATTVIHYDLPWVPAGVVQRTGRVERIGATASEVKLLFLVMEGTIEERVASLVVARAVTSMLALDVSRGADAKQTELSRSLGALATGIEDRTSGKKESALLRATRELLAA